MSGVTKSKKETSEERRPGSADKPSLARPTTDVSKGSVSQKNGDVKKIFEISETDSQGKTPVFPASGNDKPEFRLRRNAADEYSHVATLESELSDSALETKNSAKCRKMS